jgi:hypothetical protein
MFPAFWYAGKPIGLGVAPVVEVMWRFFVASILAGGSAAWLFHVTQPFLATPGALGAFARLVSCSLIFVSLYVAAVIAIHRGLTPIRQTARLVHDLLPKRAATAGSESVDPASIPSDIIASKSAEDRPRSQEEQRIRDHSWPEVAESESL